MTKAYHGERQLAGYGQAAIASIHPLLISGEF
jgi:hypothetical protein